MFWKLITAPEGVRAGLARLSPRERAVGASLVRGDARLSSIERLDIYANMYFYRLRDALRGDFGAVAAVLGESRFHNLITDYLLVHPPSHFSLRYAGQHLAGFLRGHPEGSQRPYLADLARLEWAILEAFDAAEAEPLEAGALAGVPPERWAELRFDLAPSLQLLAVGWPVHEIWRQTQRGDVKIAEPQCEPVWLRVWRQDLQTFHRAMDLVEAAALQAVYGGACFAEVCEQIAERLGEARAPERALALVSEWLGDGLLTAASGCSSSKVEQPQNTNPRRKVAGDGARTVITSSETPAETASRRHD